MGPSTISFPLVFRCISSTVTPGARSTNLKPWLVTSQNRQIGHDSPYTSKAGQRKRACCQQLGISTGVGVLHCNNNMAGAGHQVHSTAHAFDHFSWNFPVGNISLLGDFHGSQHCDIDPSRPYHAKALRTIEKAPPGRIVTVSLPALIRSGSRSSSKG